jgi:hypothetical protein
MTPSQRTSWLPVVLVLFISGTIGCTPVKQFFMPGHAAEPPAVSPQTPLQPATFEPQAAPPSAPPAPLTAQPASFHPPLSQDAPPPLPPNYLMHGPVFDANPDPNSPRGLADQIVCLQRQNEQLAAELGGLKQSVTSLQQELLAARDTATRAQQAWDQGQAELAAARYSLEAHQQQMKRALERLQESEQQHLDGLDQVIRQMQTTLQKHAASNGDGAGSGGAGE